MVLGPMSVNAEPVTWEITGEIDEIDGSPGVSIGDGFSVLVSFDSDASLVRAQTGGRFDPGTRYEYDASAVSLLVSLGSLPDQLITPFGDGTDLLWLRDNSGDRSCCEFDEVDGLTFALLDINSVGASIIFRGSILDLFNGGGLPTDPDPRLLDLEIAAFQMTFDDGFAIGRVDAFLPLPVTIDIKPGSDPNCFNVNGHGVIPVAVLGSDTFDVTNIDQGSLLFGGLEVRIRGKKGPLCNIDYSNGDAYLDLVCHFEDDASNWSAGSENATLSGTLFDGSEFEGTDSICVVP
jgi:hypothetical protein